MLECDGDAGRDDGHGVCDGERGRRALRATSMPAGTTRSSLGWRRERTQRAGALPDWDAGACVQWSDVSGGERPGSAGAPRRGRSDARCDASCI